MRRIPLVLLTGLLSDKRVFAYQSSKLDALATCDVIELNDVDTPDAMVKKINTIAPKQFSLVGHSIGGWVALKFALEFPEKLTKLCVLNTSAQAVDDTELKARQKVIDRVHQGEFEQICLEIADFFTYQASLKKAVLKMFLKVGEEALIKQTMAMMLRDDLSKAISKISCPTLIIHAANDKRFSLAVHKKLANKIPHSKLAILDDCGHMSPMESPFAVTTMLRYWLEYF